jgi:general secretion pathway protein K
MIGKILYNQRGVALIIVLWVTVLLAVMVNGFISMVRTEAQGLSNYKDESRVYYLARSGINLTIGKLLKDLSSTPSEGEEPLERWKVDGRPYRIPLEQGYVEVRVVDEGGKIDVNKATRSDLVRVLLSLGIEGSVRDTIADSILDWRDKNNFHHLNGAEDDYYGSLPEPYEAKDGPMDTVDELLWVKGVTKEIFYGENYHMPLGSEEEEDSPRVGLEDVFTVFTDSVRVNINTAPLKVLLSLPGMEEETARTIIDVREEKEFQSMGDFTLVGGKLAPTISKYITFASPKVYTIEAIGRLEGSPAIHSIKGVVKIEGKSVYKILYWKDQDRVRRHLVKDV